MNELQLAAHVERVREILEIHYTVVNPTARDVYLLNRVHDHSLLTNPDLVYIELLHTSRVVNVYKDIPEIPVGMSPTMPISPYVTALRAAMSFAEVIHLKIPLQTENAYAPRPTNVRPSVYKGLSFSLGYYWSVPDVKEKTQEIVPGVEILIPTPPPKARMEFGVLHSGPFPIEIPVLEPV